MFRLGYDSRLAGERPYGAALPYDETTPLPVPPLRFFALDAPDAGVLARRVAAYCRDEDGRLAAWFGETQTDRLAALCGMYIIAVNAPYHEQPAALNDLIAFSHAHAQHCGTIAVAQAAIYNALGLRWRYADVPGHVWVEAYIGSAWETFDATVNVWRGANGIARGFWLPDYPGWDDHRRYCQDGWCYDLALLRYRVMIGAWDDARRNVHYAGSAAPRGAVSRALPALY